MPSNHGRRFDEYQGVEELRPYSVEPHPEQTVGQEGETRVDRIVIMHPDSMAVMPEIPQSLSTVHSFAQGQVSAAIFRLTFEARFDRILTGSRRRTMPEARKG